MGTRACVLAFLVALASWNAHSQPTDFSIAGVVTDPTGAPLPGAVIKVHSYSGALAGTSVSDTAGRYRATGLAPGAYTVIASLSGFNTASHSATLSAQQSTAAVHFALALHWATGDTITIENGDPIVDSGGTRVVTSDNPLRPLPPARTYRSSFVSAPAPHR